MSREMSKPRQLSTAIAVLCGRAPMPALQRENGRVYFAPEERDCHFSMRRLVAHLPVYDIDHQLAVTASRRKKK